LEVGNKLLKVSLVVKHAIKSFAKVAAMLEKEMNFSIILVFLLKELNIYTIHLNTSLRGKLLMDFSVKSVKLKMISSKDNA